MAVCSIDLESIINRGIKRAEELSASEAEVFVVKANSTSIVGDASGVSRVEYGESIKASVRIAVGKKISTQSGTISKLTDIDDLVLNAVKIARASLEDRHWVSLPKKLGKTPVSGIIDEKVKYPDIDYFIETLVEGVRLVKEFDGRALATDSKLILSSAVRAVGNSHHSVMISEKTIFNYYIEVKAVSEGRESSYSNYYVAPTLNEFKLTEVIEEAVRIALIGLNARHVETGKYQVILMPKVLKSIIAALIVPNLRADMIQRNRSPLVNKLGQEVLSKQLTIVDDGTLPDMPGSSEFDGEGIATRSKVVFDRGKLMTYLYDTYTANIDGRESTGNAARSDGNVYPDALNIVIESGTKSASELIGELRRGLIVYETIGEWLSNPVNGYLNATISNGVLVEDGNVVHGVKDVVIAGHIYELLSNKLIAISKERSKIYNMIIPAILLDDVVIAGD